MLKQNWFLKTWMLVLATFLISAQLLSQTVDITSSCAGGSNLCGQLTYNIVLSSSSSTLTGNIDVDINFGNQAVDNFTLISSPANTSITSNSNGNGVFSLDITLTNPTLPVTLEYTVDATCSLIPNVNVNGAPITVNPVITVPSSDFTTGTISGSTCNMLFPFLVDNNPGTQNVDWGTSTTTGFFSKIYRNIGQAAFDGSIDFQLNFNCDNANSLPSLSATNYFVEILDASGTPTSASINWTFQNPLDIAQDMSASVPVNGSIRITPTVTLANCMTTECFGDVSVQWGCSNTDLCRNLTSASVKVPNITPTPDVHVNRITPTGNDVWDASCGGSYTTWQFVIYNAGNGLAQNVLLELFNPSNRSITLIDESEVSITAHPDYTLPASMPTLQFEPLNLFLNVAAQPCVSSSTNLTSPIVDPVQRVELGSASLNNLQLNAGEGFVLEIRTYRCCESGLNYPAMQNRGVSYNQWNLRVRYDADCQAGRLDADKTVASSNTTFSPLNSISSNLTAISTNSIFGDGDLYLNQIVNQGALILTGGTQAGNTPAWGGFNTLEIRNLEFLNIETFTSNEDAQIFATSPTAMPGGQLKLEFNLTPDIQLRGVAPIITDGTSTWQGNAAPIAIGANTFEVVFDLQNPNSWSGPAPSNIAQFRDFMQTSFIRFELQARCQPSNPDAVISVNTLFSPEPTTGCNECFIRLSQEEFSIHIDCPGCVTPGILATTALFRRTTMGFPDANNDGRPELTNGALAPIDPLTYPSIGLTQRNMAIVGDEVQAFVSANLQDGNNTTGFNISNWRSFYPNAAWRYLVFEHTVENAADVGFSPLGTLELEVTRATVTSTYTLNVTPIQTTGVTAGSNGVPFIRYTYLIDLLTENIYPENGDRFDLTADYRICQNPAQTVDIEAQNVLYLMVEQPTLFPPSENYTFLPDFYDNLPSTKTAEDINPTTAPTNQLIWICEAEVSNLIVFPVVSRITEKTFSNGRGCIKTGLVEIEYVIDAGSENIFEFEYRPVPGIVNEADGPVGSQGPIAFNLNIPANFTAEVSSLYTISPNYGNTVLHTYINDNTFFVNTPNALTTGPNTLTVMLNTDNGSAAYAYPIEGGPYTYIVNSQWTQQARNGTQPILFMGDERIVMGIRYNLYPICSTAALPATTIVSADATVRVPDPAETCQSPIGNTVIEDFTTFTPVALTMPGDPYTTNPAPRNHLQFQVSQVTYSGHQVSVSVIIRVMGGAHIPHGIVYFPANLPTWLTFVEATSSSPTVAYAVRRTQRVTINNNDFIAVDVGLMPRDGNTRVTLTFDLNNCSAIVPNLLDPNAGIAQQTLEVFYTWSCQNGFGQPNINPVVDNLCNAAIQMEEIDITPPAIFSLPNAEVLPVSGTCNNNDCTTITPCNDNERLLRVTLTNLEDGGIGNVRAIFNLPDEFELIEFTVGSPRANPNATGPPPVFDCAITPAQTTPITGGVQYMVDLFNFTDFLGLANGNWNCNNFIYNQRSFYSINALSTVPTRFNTQVLNPYLTLNSVIITCRVKVRPNTCDDNTAVPTYQFEYRNYCDPISYTQTPTFTFPGIEDGFTIDHESSDCVSVTELLRTAGCAGSIPTLSAIVDADAVGDIVYSWTEGTTSPTPVSPSGTLPVGSNTVTQPSPLTTGSTYTLTVAEANGAGCPITRNVTVGALYVQIDVNETCNDISATVNTPPGANYTYAWTNSANSATANTATISGLTDGVTYYVTVTDNNASCTGTSEVTVHNQALTFDLTSTNPTCNPGDDGIVSVNLNTVQNATGTLSFAWSTTATTFIINNLTAGTYTVTVTDQNGCSATGSETISTPTNPSVSIAGNNASCHPANANGNAALLGTLTATPGTVGPNDRYLWTNTTNNDTYITREIDNLVAGTYKVIFTDAYGCTATASTLITQPAEMTVSVSATNANCDGTLGALTATPTNGASSFTYQWRDPNNNPVGSITNTATSLMPATYMVTVTDVNNCMASSFGEVLTGGTLLDLTNAVTVTDIACFGGTTGQVQLSSSLPTNYTYTWSNGQSDVGLTTMSGLGTGTITVTAGLNGQCTTTASFTIDQPASALSVSATSQNYDCASSTGGSIDISAAGGTTPYTYLWSNTATSEDLSGLSAGSYYVTVTDAAGCTATLNTTITITNTLAAGVTFAYDEPCGNAATGSITATVSPTGTYTYYWGGGNTNASLASIAPGSYNLTVSTTNGCSLSKTAVLGSTSAFSLNVDHDDVICSGLTPTLGAIDVQVSGGNGSPAFTWSPSAANTGFLTGLSIGTYDVTVTEGNCIATASIDILDAGSANISLNTTNITCNGLDNGIITATPASYLYSWGSLPTGNTQNNLQAGTYYTTATFGGGCETQLAATITEPNDLAIILNINDAICSGSGSVGTITAYASGGTLAANNSYSYLWSNSGITNEVDNLQPGVYTVTVSDDNGCSTTASATIGGFELTVTTTPEHCENGDGSIEVTPVGGTGPYTYAWNTSDNTASIDNLSVGCYSVTVTDDNGCVAVHELTLTSDKEPILLEINSIQPSCGNFDGTLDLTVTGFAGPYTYEWTNWGTTVSTQEDIIANANSGFYEVIVTDKDGCETATLVALSDNNISVDFDITYPSCGDNDGEVLAVITGGTAPYTVGWYPSQTNNNPLLNVSASQIIVGVYDADYCIASRSAIIDNDVLDLSVQVQDATCSSGGSIDLTVTGGSNNYTYMWSNGACTEDLTDLPFGSYNVTVIDGNGCVNALLDITVPYSPAISISNTIGNACSYYSGSISVTATGGTTPYSYVWTDEYNNPAGTTSTIDNLGAGNYHLTVTDANGCEVTGTYRVQSPMGFDMVVGTIDGQCGSPNVLGSAFIEAIGGGTVANIEWSNSSNGMTATNLAAGTHHVTITDDFGCPFVYDFDIYLLGNYSVTGTVSGESCNTANGEIDLSVSGGSTPYSYLWSTTDVTQDLTGLTTGDYQVTVTDNDGCTVKENFSLGLSAPFSALLTVDIEGCLESNTGEVSATVTGGTAPYSYYWSNGSTSASATGLEPGWVSVYITDATGVGCSGSFGIEVKNELPMDVDITPTNCNATDGSIELTPTGGVSPYNFQWANGFTGSSLSNLTGGTYPVTVTDANGCYWQANIGNAMTSLGLSASVTDETCGQADGSINLSVLGGTNPYSYQWSKVNDNTFTNPATEDISTLSSGWYWVTVTDDDGCMESMGVYVDNMTVTAVFTANMSVATTADVVLFTNLTQGASSYVWKVNGSPAGSSTNFSYPFTTAGQYTVTLEAHYGNSCIDLEDFVVNIINSYKVEEEQQQQDEVVLIDVPLAETISIYPNPTKDMVTIVFSTGYVGENIEVQVLDITGKLIERVETTVPANGTIVHNLSMLSEGVYIVKLNHSNGVYTQRLVLVK